MPVCDFFFLLTHADAPDNCEDADCNKENETCVELTNEEVKVAHCVPAGRFYHNSNKYFRAQISLGMNSSFHGKRHLGQLLLVVCGLCMGS